MARIIGVTGAEAALGWKISGTPDLFTENTVQVFDHDEVYVTIGED